MLLEIGRIDLEVGEVGVVVDPETMTGIRNDSWNACFYTVDGSEIQQSPVDMVVYPIISTSPGFSKHP